MNFAIIQAFINDQRRAKLLVDNELGIPVDIPALEWARRFREISELYAGKPFADVFRPHGFGLEIKTADFYIDYDYSKLGLADGFDSWRIYTYIMAGEFDNRGSDKHICDRVYGWFDQLTAERKIEKRDNLYCLV